MSRSRLLLVAVLSTAAGIVLFWLYRAVPAPSHSSAAAASSLPSAAEGGVARPKVAIEQTPDFSRDPDTRPVQQLDGAAIERCHHALVGKKYIQQRVDDDCTGIEEGDDVGMQLCRRALVSDYAYLAELTAQAAGCPEALDNASDYYEALRDAALTGDDNAQACFLNGRFNNRDVGDAISQEQRDEYLPLARRFIQEAIERGDWGIVHRLAEWPQDIQGYGLLVVAYPFGPGHPDTLYKMNYLLKLGAQDATSSELPTNLVNSYRKNGELSAEQIQTAEEWARETYATYYSATPYNQKLARRSFCETDEH